MADNLEKVIVDLRKSLAWLDIVLATLNEGVLTLDENLKIHSVNDAASSTLKKERILLLGIPIWKALPLTRDSIKTSKTEFIEAFNSKRIENLNGIYSLNIQSNKLIVDVTFRFIEKINQIVVVIQDVTDKTNYESALNQETSFVKLHHEIIMAANESETFEKALQTCLSLICNYTGWQVGHVYFVSDKKELVTSNIWYLKNKKQFADFKKVTSNTYLKFGAGLPGRVVKTGKPSWIKDVTKDNNFVRIKSARIAGIKTGVAFGVVTKKEVVAILEFYSTDIIDLNNSLLDVMNHIGTQLGRVIERSRNHEERLKLNVAQAARREAEASKLLIQMSETRHRIMVEQSPQSIQILSPDGLTIQVNKAWEKLWGISIEKLGNYNILRDPQLTTLGIMKFIKKGFDGQAVEIPAVKYEVDKTIKGLKKVSPRWVRAFIYPVKNDKGKIQEVVLIHEDITSQKENEEKIKDSEERFRTLIEKSTDAIQMVSVKGQILYTSESIKNVLGYTAIELEGMGIPEFLHPDDYEHFMSYFQKIIRKPKTQLTFQYRVKHKDGTWAWLETTGVNHLNTPYINALVGTFRNITSRKKNEEELSYQKSLLEAQLEVSPEGVLVVSPNGKMVSYNKKFVKMWRFSPNLMSKGKDELALKNATKKLVDPEKFIKKVLEAYANRLVTFDELEFLDGRVFERYGSPVKGKDGTDYGYVWFFQDITERKRLERQKDDFISIASHELKTPVTSIKSFGQVLHRRFEKEGNEKAAGLLIKMDVQVDKLTSLIGDLLDVTKMHTGKVQYNDEEFEFDVLIDELIEEMQRIAENHDIKKVGMTKKRIRGDRERLGQVLTNLISNAIKYSPNKDKIIIHTSCSNNRISVCVQDFGVGIPTAQHERVFERFFRVSGPGKETFPGLGLGLFISAEIIKRHGGRIWVESIEGKGSKFCFTIPVK